MKTAFFLAFSFVFILGCEAQYPKNEVVDDTFIKTSLLNSKVDTVKITVYYQSLDKGVRASGTSDYVAHPQEWSEYSKIALLIHPSENRRYVRGYADRLRDEVKNQPDHLCGFYMIEVNDCDKQYWMHFYKCNPNYLRN